MKIEKNIMRTLKYNKILNKEIKIEKDAITISCNSQLIEYDKIINSCKEIQSKCELKLIKKLINSDTNNYIKYNIDEFIKYINNRVNKTYIIVSANIGSFLQDQKDFKPDLSFDILKTLSIYKLGTLNNMNIYINPYLTWGDSSIIEYDTEILYNYTITSIKYRPTPTMILGQDIEIDIYSNLNEIKILNKIDIDIDLF
jgi:hypothetical protein